MRASFRAVTRRSAQRQNMRESLAPFCVFGITLLAYLATLTQVHTFDALSYVTSVERKPWTAVFHPHHLAYGPLGVAAYVVGRALGVPSAALPMQVVNAFAGALGVAVFWRLVWRVTRRDDLALLAAILLGGAYAYWYYAVEIEVYTVATLFLLLCLRLWLRLLERPTLRDAGLLGLTQGAAVLFHQTNVLLCVPVALVLLAAQRAYPTRALRRWLVYALTFALSVGVPYVFVTIVVSGFRTWAQVQHWLLEYAQTGWWGGPITANTWTRLAQGVTQTLAQPGGALLWLLLLGLLVLHARQFWHTRAALVGALGLWLAVYGAFFIWWEPDNIEFWIASLPPSVLLIILALREARRWGPSVWIGFAVAAVMLYNNAGSIQRRGDAATDLQRVVAGALGAASEPADLLVIPDGLLELYLPYYERHDNFVSLNQAMFDHASQWPAACAAIQGRIEAALHAGATALIADEALHPPALLLERHRLTQAQVDVCFAAYQSDLQSVTMPSGAPAYWKLPTAQQLLERGGWNFARGPQGWQGDYVAQSSFANGWRFVPERDPALTSPLLHIDTSLYSAIEIRLANNTSVRDAQLFFAGADGNIAEERSLRWTLQATSDAVTYRLDSRSVPGWQGEVSRLRIDPVSAGDGGTMRLESVRLVR